MTVFRKKPLQDGNLLQKVLGKRLPENFLIEINNILASMPILQIKMEDINRLCRRYKVSSITMYSRRLAGFYHSFLQHCMEDRLLTKQEVMELSQLKKLLGLSDRTVREVHQGLATAIYGQELEKLINDHKIDNEEHQFLKELCSNIYLSEDLAQRILEEKAGKKLTRKLAEIMKDKRITPEEEHDFIQLCQNLGFKPDLDEHTQENFEKYKLYWQIENGDLPYIEPGIRLKPEEICCYKGEGNWYETDKDTGNLEVSELAGRIRVPRGIYWRSDSESLSGISANDWKLIDGGEILLTNKRLIYMGKMGRMVILMENIGGLVPFNDGIFLQRKKGKSPLLEITEDEADLFALMLNRLLSELK